jgi:hypothetical protein
VLGVDDNRCSAKSVADTGLNAANFSFCSKQQISCGKVQSILDQLGLKAAVPESSTAKAAYRSRAAPLVIVSAGDSKPRGGRRRRRGSSIHRASTAPPGRRPPRRRGAYAGACSPSRRGKAAAPCADSPLVASKQ